MKNQTSIGGNRGIEKTSLTMLAGFDSNDQNLKQNSLETLIRYYWKPVYKYFRLKWNQSNEQAKDLTQSFFTSLIESSTLKNYSPDISSFRHYIKVCADRFASNNDRATKALKRGGHLKMESLDFEAAEAELPYAPDLAIASEDIFHVEWLRNLVEISLLELETKMHANGKQLEFELFRLRDVEPQDGSNVPQYADLAEQFSIPLTQVTNFLASTRKTFRQIVISNIRSMTSSQAEYESELTVLFAGMKGPDISEGVACDDQ